MAIKITNFGCRLNAYEAEIIRKESGASGLGGLKGDSIIFNTCAVTAEAVRQAKQAIRKARRENGAARIIVTGCAAQTSPEAFAQMAEIDLILGNEDKLHAQSYRQFADFGVNSQEKIRVNNIMEVRENAPHMVDLAEGKSRAFVQVQNGCDHRCTFCIIPFGRGSSRSVPPGAVVEQIKQLYAKGYQEIVLTGIDLTSYGPDLPGKITLGRLVGAILAQVPQLPRLRLSSLDSIEIDPELYELIISEKRLMPHLHLSLQAGDDMILKRMKRRHLREDALRACADLRGRRPELAFGADLIAGFPTETEAMFENTRRLIADCDLAFVHIFPFSPREKTPAARMPQLPRPLVKERAAMLRLEGEKAFHRHLHNMVGTEQILLMEQSGRGYCENYTLAECAEQRAETAPPAAQLHGRGSVSGEAARRDGDTEQSFAAACTENSGKNKMTAAAGALVRCRITAHNGARLTAVPI